MKNLHYNLTKTKKIIGTKQEQYSLRVDKVGNEFIMQKVEFDPRFKTQAENTIKLVRIVRCKNENLHAALKQKYQILDSVLELSYLDPLYDSESSPSKYTALAAVCAGLYNVEHPGFPLIFLKEDQKIFKAEQILRNFMTENFLMHIEFNQGWGEVKYQDFHEQFTFPYINDSSKVNQIFEVTTSVHALLKGKQVASHLRKCEVDRMQDIDGFDDLKDLLKVLPATIKVKFKRLDNPPSKYEELYEEGILPPWPGAGTLYKITCAPSNKSDSVKRNWKEPTVFILDDSSANPLNYSDIFKTVGCFHCINCPSVNGSLAGCCHIGFMFMLLSAPYLLENSTNKPVRIVNIKNKHAVLHPSEVMDGVISSFPLERMTDERTSKNKRETNVFYNPEELLTFSDNESLDSITLRIETIETQTNLEDHSRITTLNVNQTEAQPNIPSTVGAGSTQDSQSSMYGYGQLDIEKYLRRVTKRNPHLFIPAPRNSSGKKLLQVFIKKNFFRIIWL